MSMATHSGWLSALWLATLAVPLLAGGEKDELAETIAVTKSGARIPYHAMKLDELGPKQIQYDTSGMRQIPPVPPAGVHPRMLHSPQERDELAHIYRHTEYGQTVWRMLLGWTGKLKGEITRRDQCPENAQGEMLAPYNRGGWVETGDQYTRILNGDMRGYEPDMNDYVLGCMALEAYRCWIEQDAGSGATLAQAMVNIANHIKDRVKPGDHPGVIGAYNMAFCYDYNYDFMTVEQQSLIRGVIAKIASHQSHYGAFTEPEATTSNWTTLDSFLPLTLLAIEGEDGFNEDYYRGWVRASHNFITYGWYTSGCPYEGLGKNYQFNTTMIALAKRGIDLIGHPHVRAYAKSFLPAASLPNRQGFIACDDWGGTGSDSVMGGYKPNINDIVGLKWLFPEDSLVDYVWQVYMGRNYESYNDFRPAGYYNSALLSMMFPSDTLASGDNAAESGLPMTFFCPERGYMLTRSDLSTEALFLTLHCRQDLGGHTSADRNNFVLAALGRLWGYQITMAGGSKYGKTNESRFFSVVLIDNVGQCGMSSGSFRVPGKMVAFEDTPEMTLACGDAKNAYDWEWSSDAGFHDEDDPRLSQGWVKVMETPNHFQFSPIDQPYMNQPFYERSHWLHPGKIERYVKKPWNPVRKAFRTTALIRGEHPYALIIDDIQKDGTMHQYTWMMQAAQDLEILSFAFDDDSDIADLVLCGREVQRDAEDIRRPKVGDPLLLVRVLQCNNEMSRRRYTPVGRIEQYMSNVRWPKSAGKRLVIPSWSVSPEYKILLLPYRHGDELPTTRWNHDGTQLTVEWTDQRDLWVFKVDADGRTHVHLRRNE